MLPSGKGKTTSAEWFRLRLRGSICRPFRFPPNPEWRVLDASRVRLFDSSGILVSAARLPVFLANADSKCKRLAKLKLLKTNELGFSGDTFCRHFLSLCHFRSLADDSRS